jgi:large subunit ribosomal protein L10
MPTEAKLREVEGFSGSLNEAQSVVLTDFTGLDVAAISDLRRRCREAGVQYRVVKNTLAKRAVEQAGMQDLVPLLEGPNAWALHQSDQVAAAKVLAEFAKDHAALTIRGGFMEGRLLSVEELEALAKLPSRDTLLAQTLAVFQAPMTGFAGVLTALLRGFATAVDAYSKKRADSEGA